MKTRNAILVLALALLAGPAAAQEENTLVVTLKGLPPPSTSPPAAPNPGYPAYRQPPVQARPSQPPAPTPGREVVARLGVCEVHGAPIYRGRNDGGRLISRVPRGQFLAIKSEYGDWYAVLMIDNSIGWILRSTVRLLEYNVTRNGPATPGIPTPGDGSEGLAEEVIREAIGYLKVPYVWGGNGRSGLDCSGLVKNCFARCGVSLPRRASHQALIGQPVPLDLSHLQPGDRLYFAVKGSAIDHTGIYLGRGLFIHASRSHGQVAIDPLKKPLYLRNLVAARRS